MARYIKCDRCQTTQDQFIAMQDHWRKLTIGSLLDGLQFGGTHLSYELCPICAREVGDIITEQVLKAAGLDGKLQPPIPPRAPLRALSPAHRLRRALLQPRRVPAHPLLLTAHRQAREGRRALTRTANPIQRAYDQAILHCRSVATRVENTEHKLGLLYVEFDEAHAALNAAHDAMKAADLLPPQNGEGIRHKGIDLPTKETVWERTRRRLPGFHPRGLRIGKWDDDDEDETTD